MLIRIVAMYFVAIVLFVILVSRSPMITRTVYKSAFFLGAAAVLVFLIRPGGAQMDWIEADIGRGRLAYVFACLLGFLMPLPPLVVLAEAGIAGYRGFSSLIRYGALALAVFGVAGLAASLLVPRLIQR